MSAGQDPMKSLVIDVSLSRNIAKDLLLEYVGTWGHRYAVQVT